MVKKRTYLYDVYIEKRSTKPGTAQIGRTKHDVVRGTSLSDVRKEQSRLHPHTAAVRNLIFVFRNYG